MTVERGRELIREARGTIAAAQSQNQGNDIALRSAIDRARAESTKEIEQEFAKLQGQNVEWRFTVREVSQFLGQVRVYLKESPGAGLGGNEAGLYIRFGDDWGWRDFPIVGKEVSKSLAEKLRPGDPVVVKGRVRMKAGTGEVGPFNILNQNFNIEIQLIDLKVESADATLSNEENAREEQERIAREQERTALEKRTEAARSKLVAATAPGMAYNGTLSRSVLTREIHSLRLVFTTQNGRLITAEATSPDKPDEKQAFKGEINPNPQPEFGTNVSYPILMGPTRRQAGLAATADVLWFFRGSEGSLELRPTDTGLEGRTGGWQFGGWTVSLQREYGGAGSPGDQPPEGRARSTKNLRNSTRVGVPGGMDKQRFSDSRNNTNPDQSC